MACCVTITLRTSLIECGYMLFISQVMSVHRTSLFVTMECAFMMIIGVMTIMTVEITVMKMDVSEVIWEEMYFTRL